MSIWTLFSSVKTFRSFSLWYGCVCVCKCYSIPHLYSTEQPSGFSSLSLTPQQRGFYLSRESFKNLFSKFLVKLDYTSSSKWSSRVFQGLFKHTFFLKHGTSPVCKPMVHLHSLNTPEFFRAGWIFLLNILRAVDVMWKYWSLCVRGHDFVSCGTPKISPFWPCGDIWLLHMRKTALFCFVF